MKKFISDNYYKIFLAILWIIATLPLLAPILASLKLNFLASAIYWIYSFSCHQLAHRSIHINDHQCAWCARDTFIWGGIALTATAAPHFKLKNFNLFWIIPFVVPIALDGGIQTIATMLGLAGGDNFYTSTNFMRAVTGSIFGIGLGLFFYQIMGRVNEVREELKEKKENSESTVKPYLKFIGIIFSTLMVLYMGLVQIWGLTSTNFEPANPLDLAVRTPADETAWQRQINGTCEPDEPKIVNGESFSEFTFTPGECF